MATVRVSPKLADYLRKKNVGFILCDLAQCKSCGGAIAELFCRPAKPAEIERLGDAARTFPAVDDAGNQVATLVVARRTIKVGEEVDLDLRRFLGAADITASGLEF